MIPIRADRIRCPRAFLGAALVSLLFLSGCGTPRWHDEPDHRWRELRVRGSEAGFRLRSTERLGIDFVNTVDSDARVLNRTLADGSGLAIGDVDGDGLADLYFASVDGPNALYLNRGGWDFEDRTELAGVGLPDHRSTGTLLADLDGDADLDLVVSGIGGPTRVFLNDGSGLFTPAPADGLGGPWGSRTVTAADIDGDGDLDLYVANNKARVADDLFSPDERAFDAVVIPDGDDFRIAEGFEEHYRVERSGSELRRLELADPDELWINEGGGTFRPAEWTDGRFLDQQGEPLAAAPRDWGLSANFHDLDGDADPDLYVCNDFETPDRIWINQGDGTFRAAPWEMIRTTSLACMSVAFGDPDRNGHTDFFTADMLSRSSVRERTQLPAMANEVSGPGAIRERPQRNRNTYQLSRGDGTFADVAHWAGIAGSEWTWGTRFLDVDLDGYEDLLTVNGHAWNELDGDVKEETRAVMDGPNWRDERRMVPPLELRNLAFHNRGDGTFEEVGADWGFGTDPDVAHGLATGDLDGDGDLDVVVSRLDLPPLVFENRAEAPRVAVRLSPESLQGGGVGARVRLLGTVPEQAAEFTAGDGYLTDSERMVTFAATGDGPFTLEVVWQGGDTQRIEGVRANRLYEIRRVGAEPRLVPPPERPWFSDVSLALGHAHNESTFDDFRRQPMLPLKLSQLGPGVALQDLDRDGDPDLIVSAGAGGRLAHFINDRGRLELGARGPEAGGLDQGAVVVLPSGNRTRVLVGRSNHEAESQAAALQTPTVVQVEGSWSGSGVLRSAPVVEGALDSAGPLALADVDGDGDLDLFVGARAVPTAYPLPATSRLFLNDGDGGFDLDAEAASVLTDFGLVSGAVFSDIDIDGDPDLILATEWGPIRVLQNAGGVFSEATTEWDLDELSGRWIGIATGDFDSDGRPDLVATGWGLNTRYRATGEHPLRLIWGDFDRNGSIDVLEAEYDDEVAGYAPIGSLPEIARGIPALLRSVGSFDQFSRLTVSGLLGSARQSARESEAAELAHTVFLNRDGRFEPVRLPAPAQWSPAFGVVVADFDADGSEDLFLGQNLYATDAVSSRHDAGRGILLRGDGSGGFQEVPGSVTGIAVYGDARGAAVGDIDQDGRVDLVVTQNGAATKVFMNRTTEPGLLVQLEGPRENPQAIGARIRLEYADGRLGPVRELQAGSGYWSSNSSVPVMGRGGQLAAVIVVWPDGSRTRTSVEPNVLSVLIRKGGGR